MSFGLKLAGIAGQDPEISKTIKSITAQGAQMRENFQNDIPG
jgi:hypothetical protein